MSMIYLSSMILKSVDDSKVEDQMDEREELLPLVVADHEWIAGRDTLCWAPCR